MNTKIEKILLGTLSDNLKEEGEQILMNTKIENPLFEALLDDLKERKDDLSKPYNITAFGIYNHGKSTLLNALIDSIDDSIFATSDERETKEVQEHLFEDMCYTDTPGINMTQEDDDITRKAMEKSHLNLFVHSISTGDLNKQEAESLKMMAEFWENKTQFLKNTIFILNDFGDKEDEIKEVEAKITSQIREIFGNKSKANMLIVNAKMYQKGKQDNKQKLVEQSNIEQLRAMIQNTKKQFAKEKIMYRRLIKRLDTEIEEREKQLTQYKANINKLGMEVEAEIEKIKFIKNKE